MPLPPTPWIKSYDNPELYLGGYRSGLEQQQITQRGQLAAQELNQRAAEAANRMAMAQMENQTRRELAMQELAMEEHRRKIQDEQWGMERRLGEQKLQEFASRAAAQLRIQARIKAGEDPLKVYSEEGPTAGSAFGPSDIAALTRANKKQNWVFKKGDPATGAPDVWQDETTGAIRSVQQPRAAAKDPMTVSQLRALEKKEEAWNKVLVDATIEKNEDQVDLAKKQLQAIGVERQRLSGGTNAPQASMRLVLQPDGSYILERTDPTSAGEAIDNLNSMNLKPLLPGTRDDAVLPFVPLNLPTQ